MVSINFEIEIDIEIDVSAGATVEIELDYGMDADVEVEVVVEVEAEPPAYEVEFDTNGWQGWGNSVHVPARGWFAQFGNKQQMHFDTFVRMGDVIRGAGSDGVGEFDIYGRFQGNHFTFAKQYRGAHCVYYKGTYRNNSVMTGMWEIPNNCEGTFNIQPAWQRWRGQFYQFGNGNEMRLDHLYVGNSGVRGDGADGVGQFELRGWKSGSTVCFAKHYQGAHTVFYQGELDGRRLRGCWTIPGNCDGVFEMHCNRALW